MSEYAEFAWFCGDLAIHLRQLELNEIDAKLDKFFEAMRILAA